MQDSAEYESGLLSSEGTFMLGPSVVLMARFTGSIGKLRTVLRAQEEVPMEGAWRPMCDPRFINIHSLTPMIQTVGLSICISTRLCGVTSHIVSSDSSSSNADVLRTSDFTSVLLNTLRAIVRFWRRREFSRIIVHWRICLQQWIMKLPTSHSLHTSVAFIPLTF